MNLSVAVHAPFVEGKDVKSRDGLMAPQHMHVAFLAQFMGARGQQTDIVGPVRRMASKTVLSHRGMLPQQRAALVRVALITKLVGVAGLEHLAAFSTVRIMTGSASHFHANWLSIQLLPRTGGHKILRPEQVRGTLEQSFSLFSVATETSLIDSEIGQHLVGQLGVYDLCGFTLRSVSEFRPGPIQQLDMMDIVARQAAHIASIVLTALPVEMAAIHRVTLQA